MASPKVKKPFKKSGKPQRADVVLTEGIAGALANLLLDGKSIYPKTNRVELTYQGADGEEIHQTLSCNTLKSWIERGNVIPRTGQLLREFLEEKRALKRRLDRDAAQDEIILAAEEQLRQIAKISLSPRPDVERSYKILPNGKKLLTRETHIEFGTSPKMLEAVTRAASFSLERLDPDRYSSKTETKNTHFVFSLADIQRIRDQRSASSISQSQEI